MIQDQNGTLVVSGELGFATVVKLWRSSVPLLSQYSELHFDLAQVTSSNSAGLALILEWVKYAKMQNKSIDFRNIPAQLMSIVTVSGIEEMVSLT